MKKFLSLAAYALLAVALPLSLASCGGDKDDDDEPDKPFGFVTSLAFTQSTLELNVGDEPAVATFKASPAEVSYITLSSTSSDKSVCTVAFIDDQSVRITPVAAGTATVTIASVLYPDVKATIAVTVKAAPEPEEEPSSVFSIKDKDGHYHLLTAVGSKPVEYDAQGRFTNICGMTRISEGRYRNGNQTLTLTFKSGTPLVTRLVTEYEYTGGRSSYTHTFTYDAQGRLTRAAWTEISAPSIVVAYDLTWDEEKLLSAKGTFHDNPSTYTFYYQGNQSTPLQTLGYMPLGRIVTNPNIDDQVWAALCLTGCFGKNPTLLPTSVDVKNAVSGSDGTYQLTYDFNDDGTTKSDGIKPSIAAVYGFSYKYRDDK
ncbi:MAG: DUF4595 domain-containing protein [Bacteroidaceae bacterium]|nr:DUF4595 domain-containing protein [Bacteroidaceae bacterium]